MNKTTLKSLRAIRDDHVHGSSFLAQRALDVLYNTASRKFSTKEELESELLEVSDTLCRMRPCMASLISVHNSVVIYTLALSSVKPFHKYQRLVKWSIKFKKQSLERQTLKTARRAEKSIPRNACVFTYSASRAVYETLKLARRKKISVLISEGRPLFEGREMAKKIVELGIPVTLFSDASCAYMMKNATLVLVGADGILHDGSIVNKIGTLSLALAAKHYGIPFYVIAESYKIFTDKIQFVPEENSSSELGEKIRGVEQRNYYFEITPPRLVSAIYTYNVYKRKSFRVAPSRVRDL